MGARVSQSNYIPDETVLTHSLRGRFAGIATHAPFAARANRKTSQMKVIHSRICVWDSFIGTMVKSRYRAPTICDTVHMFCHVGIVEFWQNDLRHQPRTCVVYAGNSEANGCFSVSRRCTNENCNFIRHIHDSMDNSGAFIPAITSAIFIIIYSIRSVLSLYIAFSTTPTILVLVWPKLQFFQFNKQISIFQQCDCSSFYQANILCGHCFHS